MNDKKLEIFFRKIIELRWFICVLFGLMMLFGFHSLNQVKIDAIPDITNKQVVVNTKTFGMDPTRIEKSVTYPIEAELYGIPGLLDMRSISKFGLSQIVLIFRDDVDIYFARTQVMQRLSMVGNQIPQGLTPTIAPLTTGIGEILIYRLYNKATENSDGTNAGGIDNLMELRTIQQFQVARELKRIVGVAEVDTIGGYERELHLNASPHNILKYGMTTEKLIWQIQTVGENFGGGYIEQDGKQKIVRTFANIQNYQNIMDLPIKIDYTGNTLPLKDIVEIRQDYSQRLGAATNMGKETVIGTVMLQSGENAKEVLTKVKHEIAKFNQRSSKVQIEILYDRQFLIDQNIKTVMKNLAEGILLVIGVLCLVLGNVKIGLIIAATLPFCIFILAACMNLFGISANLMSLGALDFGLLVDSSVVLVEFILANLLLSKNTEDKANSVAKLSAQVVKPIFFGILIIILVYIPILMLSGIEGKTFKPMAINVIIALIASIVIAFLLMPILSYFFISEKDHKESRFFGWIKKRYEQVFDLALRNGKRVIFCCGIFFAFSVFLFSVMSSDFLPDLNEGDVVFEVITENGTSLSKAKGILQNLELEISKEKEVERSFSRIGASEVGLDPMMPNAADLFVILKKEYKGDARKISDKIQNKIKALCEGCDISQSQPIKMRFNEMLEGSRADLSLRVFGEDFNVLIDVAKKIEDILETKSDIKEVSNDLINSIRKSYFINIIPNYDAIVKNQSSIADVGKDVEDAMAGIKIGNFYATEFPIPIVLHLSEKDRNDPSLIGNIAIGLGDGGSFPLSKVSNMQESEDISVIPRLFGKRYSSLSIYLKHTNYSDFITKIESEIKKNNIIPNGYYIEWGGRFENFNSAKKQIFTLIPIILAIIFLILWKMFSRFKEILIVLSSVLFALSGAILLLFICKIPITVSVYIGFITLIGISLLNSIILINTFNKVDDLKSACLLRLRPILMTAIVASLGFLPMAFGFGIGAEVQQPIAITVIGGIISSTITTLILSPILIKKFIAEMQE
ncbi:MAG: CusA/CzcA family heavy metal efflux RND transporter [Proteobacteria bacterium]|nr:CusA/CzcA family heavy metal efflux RND transporter [Pseudomonadota bacterium]